MNEMTNNETPGKPDLQAVCDSTAIGAVAESQESVHVYDPFLVERPGGRVEVRAMEENTDLIPWGFWGGVISAVMAVIIVFRGSTGQITMWDVMWASTALFTGLILFRLGRRSALEERLLCEIDTEYQLLSWPTSTPDTVLAVAFDDIEELSFAVTRVPVEGSRANTKLDAVTVRVRDGRDRELTVIPPSTSKTETHRIARLLGDLLGLSVNYVGTGVREWV